MSVLEDSLALAKQGVRFFQCISNSKLPAVKKFSEIASNDPVRLKGFFDHTDYNSGIACGFVSEGLYLVGVDIDNKDGRNGFVVLENFEILGMEFPETWSQITPTGGKHFLFWSPVPIRQGANVLGVGIDLRGDGGYLIGPGSKISGKEYLVLTNLPIAMAPDWFIEKYQKTATIHIIKPKSVGIPVGDQLMAFKLSIELLKSLPVLKTGERNVEGFKIVCRIKDLGLDASQVPDLLKEYWRCEPMLEDQELEVMIASAYKTGKNQIGVSHPQNVFDIVRKEEKSAKDFIDEMNEKYFYCTSNGLVYEEMGSENGFLVRDFFVEIFHLNLLPQTVTRIIKDAPKKFQKSKLWLENSRRREYDFVRFIPKPGVDAKTFNLWRGFNSKPIGPDEQLDKKAFDGHMAFIQHCLENICDHDENAFKWLMAFVAHIFQKPWEKPPVALVFHGEKGVGKNVFIDVLKFMIGRHATTISDRGILTARFNAIMEDKILIAFDEAFWSGDKSTEGKLKSIITDTVRNIERKGKEHYPADVCDRIVIMGNEDRLVNATTDERRYAAFNVASHKQGDSKFFGLIMDGIREHGGDKLLMRYFLDYDISKFDLRKAPETDGLREQKEHSLSIFDIWWRECLRAGRMIGDYSGTQEWPQLVSSNVFCDYYRQYLETSRQKEYSLTSFSIGKKFKKIAPSCALSKNVSNQWSYVFCSLGQARQEWNKITRLNETWE